MEEILVSLIEGSPTGMTIAIVLGGLSAIGQTVVVFTKSEKDDKLVDDLKKKPLVSKALTILRKFAPLQKDELVSLVQKVKDKLP